MTSASQRPKHRGRSQVTAFAWGVGVGLFDKLHPECLREGIGQCTWTCQLGQKAVIIKRALSLCHALCHGLRGLSHSVVIRAHFTGEATEAQRGKVTYPVFSTNEGRKLDSEPQRCLVSKPLQHWPNDQNSRFHYHTMRTHSTVATTTCSVNRKG